MPGAAKSNAEYIESAYESALGDLFEQFFKNLTGLCRTARATNGTSRSLPLATTRPSMRRNWRSGLSAFQADDRRHNCEDAKRFQAKGPLDRMVSTSTDRSQKVFACNSSKGLSEIAICDRI